MKNKFLKGFLAAVVIALSGYGINKGVNNSNTKLNDLTLANIEALADGESFSFNGQDWTTEHKWYNHFGHYFSPKKVECVTDFVGQKIVCVYGDGNCFNGTDCIPD